MAIVNKLYSCYVFFILMIFSLVVNPIEEIILLVAI